MKRKKRRSRKLPLKKMFKCLIDEIKKENKKKLILNTETEILYAKEQILRCDSENGTQLTIGSNTLPTRPWRHLSL